MVFLPLVSGQFDPLRCGPSDQPVLEVSWPKLGGNARRPYPPDGGLRPRRRIVAPRSQIALKAGPARADLNPLAPEPQLSERAPLEGLAKRRIGTSISWHFERDSIPYALETDWPVGAAGF